MNNIDSVLVALGNVKGKYSTLPNDRYRRIDDIVQHLSELLQCSTRFRYIISGRVGSLSIDLFSKFSPERAKETVTTFVPNLEMDKSTKAHDYNFIGTVLEAGIYAEARREAMVQASKLVLISDGNRGVSSLLQLAKRLQKKIIPLPFGFETDSEFRAECAAFGRRIEGRGDPALNRHWATVRNLIARPDEVATSILALMEAYDDGNIRRSIFITLPLTSSTEVEMADIVNSIKSVANEFNFDPTITQNTDGQTPLIDGMLDGMNSADSCIAILDHSRPNIYYESGYMKGQGKPVLFFCREDRLTEVAFDVRSYEVNTWSNQDDFKHLLKSKLRLLGYKGIQDGLKF